jgi:multidrug efflux system membrane fusion protein
MKPLHGTSHVAAALVVALAAASALSGGCAGGKDKRTGLLPVPVLTADAVSMDVPLEIGAIGRVEAYNTISVTARVGGQLLEVGFREGQDVGPGDILFQIDPGPYRAALDQAQANLERDRAMMANADADLARYADLVRKDYVTQQQYDSFVSAAAQAKATVQADEAVVQSARLNLEYCTIRSPIAGRTGNLLVKRGNLVAANGPSPLVTINQIVPIYVSFAIPESQLADVRRYSRQGTLAAQAYVPPDSVHAYGGKLTFIDNAVDQGTGTILLKATFPNESRALWPGQFVRVNLVLTKLRNATVVPSAAVQTSQQGEYVYVLASDDTAELRSVVQGPRFGDLVVIEKGVETGERVVTDGQLRLTPGAKTTIKTGLAPAGPGAAQGAAGDTSAPAAGGPKNGPR